MSSEGSVISWPVSSDPGCPARDVAPPSVENKHKQLWDHRQADKKERSGRRGAASFESRVFATTMHKEINPSRNFCFEC